MDQPRIRSEADLPPIILLPAPPHQLRHVPAIWCAACLIGTVLCLAATGLSIARLVELYRVYAAEMRI